MELNNLPYLVSLAELGVPLVLSTGMGSFDEIISAVETIASTGNSQLIILHCTAIYPSKPDIIRLNNILGLRNEFPQYPIGYSDHSVGIEIPTAAVALGACLIEKHFTLDSSRIGLDNQMATEPEDVKNMVLACTNVYDALGGMERVLCSEEKDQIPKMRRSLVAKKILRVGDLICDENVEFKRPGDGIPPSEYGRLIGGTVLKNIEKGDPLTIADINVAAAD
jgi:N-acetylneuraminate synthase